MYAVVDALGNPIKFIMSKGQRHDSKFLIRLLMELKMNNCNVLAEQAYNTDEILKYINTNDAIQSNAYFKNLNGSGGPY